MIEKIETAGYGLLVMSGKLLCVSNDGEFWYLPGGRQEPGEDLQSCVRREFYEETGLEILCYDMVALMEVIDPGFGKHKVTALFHVTLQSGALNEDWKDCGQVKHRRFFSHGEILANEKIVPRRILTNPFWQALPLKIGQPFYFGFEPFTIKD